jgi:hypothetical protein
VDVLVAARGDRVDDGLLPADDQLFVGVANDVLTGMDLAGSLLTGGRPVPSLVARRGTSLAPVATVSDSLEGPSAGSALPGQETLWIDFVIGLDDTIPPRHPALVEPDAPTGDEGEPDLIRSAAAEEEDLPTAAAGVSRAGLEGAQGLATEWVLALSAALLLPAVAIEPFVNGGGRMAGPLGNNRVPRNRVSPGGFQTEFGNQHDQKTGHERASICERGDLPPETAPFSPRSASERG